MVRSPLRVLTCTLSLLMLMVSLPGPVTLAGETMPGTLVYHQITNIEPVSGSIGSPMLSGDGSVAVFADAPASSDPDSPNRIFTIGWEGGNLREVDAYTPRCACAAHLGISDDGERVVSTDSMQVRVAGGGSVETLLSLNSNEITWVAMSGDGETVFILFRRDAATDDGVPIQRGVWAIDLGGGNLRQVVGVEDVAALLGYAVDQAGCCFHGDGHPLAVSDDGGQVVFASYGLDGEYVIGADGDGGNLHVLSGPAQYVMRVAISGEGTTAAWDTVPAGAARNEVAAGPFDGGASTVFDTPPATEYREPLQLTADGSSLLLSPNGLLIDTTSGESRILAVAISGMGGNHEAVLTDGLPRGTMDAEGEKFLYAMRVTRCADCLNLPEQLATLELDPGDPGLAPVIGETAIDPVEIGLAGSSATTITSTIDLPGEVSGAGVVALLDDTTVDVNLGGQLPMLDDGMAEDSAAGDGVYTTGPVAHAPVEAREADTGSRTIRVAAEYEDGDGLRHATAVDAGILTVTGG